jgi:nifR3 family TIM-barrel protein
MKIGKLTLKNNVFMAPMAGITDLGFRTIVRDFGCSLCFTEMISAAGLMRGTEKSYRYLDSALHDRPLGVQIFGSDPNILSDAAKIASETGADIVDINMGCPARKVLKNGAGAALMKNPQRVSTILKSIRKVVDIPLSIKIRSGWNRDTINAVEIALIAEDCGVDVLIIHPRTVTQGFGGMSDWNLIGEIKYNLGIPVIGSGDIKTPQDALRMQEMTGCDAVMIGRGALGRPWIFKEILTYFSEGNADYLPSPSEIKKVILRHLEKITALYGKKRGIINFRKHLLWYTKGLRNSSQFRQSVVTIAEKEELVTSINRYFESLEYTEFDKQRRDCHR